MSKTTRSIAAMILVMMLLALAAPLAAGQGEQPRAPASPYPEVPAGEQQAATSRDVGSMAPAALTASPGIPAAGNWLLSVQDPSGGFGWVPGGTVYGNTQGPTARGLLKAYEFTGNATYLSAATDTGDYLVPNYPDLYTDLDPRFATYNPWFLEELSQATGDPTYSNFVQTYFWDKLTADTYGEANDMDAADFAASVVTGRTGQGIPELSPWDLAGTAIGAHVAGETASRNALMGGVLAGLHATTTAGGYDVIGLAGAVWASAVTGMNLDPTVGIYASASSTSDLAVILSGLTLTADNGAWLYDSTLDPIVAGNGDLQTTAFAMLALDAHDRSTYLSQIMSGKAFAGSLQQTSGEFLPYPGASPGGGGSTEVQGETISSIVTVAPQCTTTCYADAVNGDDANGGASAADAKKTIGAAVSQVQSGGTVNVAAGTYPENPSITKSLSLYGPQKDTAVGGRTAGGAAEASVAGAGGIAVTVSADNVEVNGLTIQNPTGTAGIYAQDRSNLAFKYNFVTPVGSSIASQSAAGIYVKCLNAGVANVEISNNEVSQIHAGANKKSAKGIHIGDTNGVLSITGLVIRDNLVSHVTSDTNPWPVGGGAYGIILSHGTAGGQTVGAQVLNNTITDLDGLWAHGIGLESDTPNAVVTGNTISNLTDHKSPSDAVGILFEDNPSGATVDVSTNKLATTVDYGVAVHPDDLPGGANGLSYVVDADTNWWGDMFGPGPVGPGSGSGVGPNVTYSPWCADVGCTFTLEEGPGGEVMVSDGMSQAEIQAVLDAAPAGTTILFQAGTYGFSLSINNPGLTLTFEPGVVFSPSSPCWSFWFGATFNGNGAVCEPSSGSNGFETMQDLSNLTIRDWEIRKGTGKTTGDGVYVGHNVTNLRIVDCYMHDLDQNGIYYASGKTVGGVHEVQGNLFQTNTGDGVYNASTNTYDVSYNSWGALSGPTGGGDGATGPLTTSPFTHMLVSTVSSGSLQLDKVRVGYDIDITVQAESNEAWGADFDMGFDNTLLSVVSITDLGSFNQHPGGCVASTPAQANGSGVISFCGNSLAAVNGATAGIYQVKFTGIAPGVSALDLDDTTDAFAMAPPSGASTNIYAEDLVDGQITVYAVDNVTGRIDLQGRTDDTGAQMEFGVGTSYSYGPYLFTPSDYWGAISVSDVVHDAYPITTDMNRYLDVTAASGKSKGISAPTTLTTLVLLGGDANDTTDGTTPNPNPGTAGLIDIGDATVVGNDFGNSPPVDVRADINNDLSTDILDLVLVGGNYGKVSATAYGGWSP